MSLWNKCIDRLEGELSSQQFNTWIRPLQSIETSDSIRLLAPNQFVLNWVKNHHLAVLKLIEPPPDDADDAEDTTWTITIVDYNQDVSINAPIESE